MKQKTSYLITFLIAFCMFGSAYAETNRHSTGVEKASVEFAYEDYDFDNVMTESSHTVPATWNQGYDNPVDRSVLMLRASYGVLDQMDVFVGLGYADETWNARDKSDGSNYTEQTGKDLIWELGIKGTAVEFMESKLYLAYLMKYSYLKTGDGYVGVPNPTSSDVTWKQYDVDLEVGYQAKPHGLKAYAGIKYFDVEAEQNTYAGGTHYSNKYENEDNVAYFIGFSKAINDQFDVNVEGMFGGKEGIKLGLKYKF